MRDSIEVYVNAALRDIPIEVRKTLEAICAKDPDYSYPDSRWRDLFDAWHTSPFPLTCTGSLTQTSRNTYTLFGKGTYADDKESVKAFFAWLDPWIEAEAGEFVGYLRSEDDKDPELFFKC